MQNQFRNHIKTSLENPVLQAALDGNAQRRITVRQQAFASLPDFKAMRARAHAVRADVIDHLDEYLQQFAQQAESNGFILHAAADAAQAVNIVLEIARQKDASLVAKSKTMVSEEIHLNTALQQAGIQVVETDLGEYIVQLRGEPPAHIITPAVHLRRQEVGQTFHEKLGIPLTDDIPTLTRAARAVLRQVFLTAGIGLSGVNFGVAENGAVCLLTNEGNGRMVTTVPPVHVALMGIERLVPTMDDLALMLDLLPRSATGQKLTVYTNLIYGPRRPGDPDGPLERHLVLVDNGRRTLRTTPLAEILYCIRCGACLNACPIFRELGGHSYVSTSGQGSPYPGPLGSVLSPGLFGQAEFAHLARASSLCGACKEACPVAIDLPRLLLRVRAGKTQPASPDHPPAPEQPQAVPGALSAGLKVFSWTASRPWWYTRALRAAGFFSRLLSPRRPWLRLPPQTGWGYSKDFPRPAARSFRDRWAHISLVDEPPAAAPAQPRLEPTAPAPVPAPGAAERLEKFKTELTALGGTFEVCAPGQAASRVLAVLHSHGVDRLSAWGSENLPAGVLEALAQAGVSIVFSPDPQVKAGLTGCLGAAAETGSLLLTSGPGRPLTASLLPELHIALLQEDAVQDRLSDLFSLGLGHGPDTAVVISGPSRTADIEMTLTIGVHGPGQVHVICLSEASGLPD